MVPELLSRWWISPGCSCLCWYNHIHPSRSVQQKVELQGRDVLKLPWVKHQAPCLHTSPFSDEEHLLVRKQCFPSNNGDTLGAGQLTKEQPGCLFFVVLLQERIKLLCTFQAETPWECYHQACPGPICKWDGSQSWCPISASSSSYIVLTKLCRSLHMDLRPL